LLFAGCKKYEDGPGISLRSKQKRITGYWELQGTFADGIEQSIADSSNCKNLGLTSAPFSCTCEVSENSGTPFNLTLSTNGTWEFGNDKTTLDLHFDSANLFKGITLISESWTIYRLANNYLWIAAVKDGVEYKFKYKKRYQWN